MAGRINPYGTSVSREIKDLWSCVCQIQQGGTPVVTEDSESVTFTGDGTSGNPLIATAVGGGGATGANPTATLGLAAINGVATTFMRSDAAPALSQAIVPVWTGSHSFTFVSTLGNAAGISAIGAKSTSPTVELWNTAVVAGDQKRWAQAVTTTGGTWQLRAYNDDGTTGNNGIAIQIFRSGGSAIDCHILNVSGTTQVKIDTTNGITAAKLVGTGTRPVTVTAAGLLVANTNYNSQAGTTYNVLATDTTKVIGLSNTAARTITLPAANTIPSGVIFWIKDEAGTAGANNITVNRAGADTIDGNTSVTMTQNYQSIGLYSNGVSAWFIV